MEVSGPKLLLRLVNPSRLLSALRAGRERERSSRTELDPQLRLYARMLGHGHLHYGFFEDAGIDGEAISLGDLRDAQRAHSELILEELPEGDRPVLDCGCGMGGILELLAERGHRAVGLTPDRAQVEYIRETLDGVRVEQTRFEDLDGERHAGAYRAIICSESMQYLDLDRAFELAGAILAPGGRWIICDYFRRHDRAHESSGHLLDAFHTAIREGGWSVRKERDITDHVIGTLRYAHTMADRLGRPLVDFLLEKLRAKRPALYDLYRDELAALDDRLDREMKTIDPEQFRRDKTYRLYVLERD